MKARDIIAGWPRGRSTLAEPDTTAVWPLLLHESLWNRGQFPDMAMRLQEDYKANLEYHRKQAKMVEAYHQNEGHWPIYFVPLPEIPSELIEARNRMQRAMEALCCIPLVVDPSISRNEIHVRHADGRVSKFIFGVDPASSSGDCMVIHDADGNQVCTHLDSSEESNAR